jgi:glycosyltransferase involved in cell wall biosynthesis
MPRVSICIPTYNRSHLVSRAIDSALSQSETDIEVVLLDDASTDNTREIIASYKDSRLRVESAPRPLGLDWGFNRSLEIARGTYVTVLCDDDLLYPECVSLLADGLDRFPDASFASSAWHLIDARGATIKTIRLVKDAPASGTLVDLRRVVATSWLCHNRIGGTSSVLMRRAALEGGRFKTRYAQMFDWDMWLRLLKRGPLLYLPRVLSAYRMHDGSLSARHKRLAQTASDLLSISADLAGSLGELRGAVSKFDLKRLQGLCFLSASEYGVRNLLRCDLQKVIQNLAVAKRAIAMLFDTASPRELRRSHGEREPRP